MSWQSFDAMDREDTEGLVVIYQPMADDPADDPAPRWGVVVGNDGETVTMVPLDAPDDIIVADVGDFDLPGMQAILDMTEEQVSAAERIRAKYQLHD